MKKKIAIIGLLICLLLVGSIYAYADTIKLGDASVKSVATIKDNITPQKKAIVDEEKFNKVKPTEETTTTEEQPIVEVINHADNNNEVENNIEPIIIEEQSMEEESVVDSSIEETVTVEEPIIKETYELTETLFEIDYPEETKSQEVFEGEISTPEISDTDYVQPSYTEVYTIDAAVAEPSVDGVEVEFAQIETTIIEEVRSVSGKYLGLPNRTKKAITVIGNDTMMDINKLQSIIDGGNIVCYPSCDITQGVKYLAGHNPGAMSHINSISIGSIVRFSNDSCYQDYKVVERLQNVTGSFANAYFSTAGQDAWTMLTRGTENALIIQFCVNGQNNLWYCRAV